MSAGKGASGAAGSSARRREDGLHYPLGERRPDAGETIEIAPGVHWLRMPLPFRLDHINLWLLEDGDGYAIVDCGLLLEETKRHWLTLFERFGIAHGGRAGRPVTRLIVTHFHPDHIGLAGWLAGLLDAEFWITRTEWLMARMLYLDSDAASHRSMADFFILHGLAPALAGKLFAGGNTYRQRVGEAPWRHRRLRAGDALEIGGRRWEIVVGTGHAPEHACLWAAEDGILIAGDQILPRITPNISVWASEPDASPLADYLDSFAGFAALPDDTLVLPSHNLPFRGVQTRIGQIVEHHRVRLERLSAGFTGGNGGARLSAADAVPLLFRRELDLHQMGFAMGECLAHLAWLEGEGRLAGRRDPDGIHRFERT